MEDCLIRRPGVRPPCWCSAAVAMEELGRWLSAACPGSPMRRPPQPVSTDDFCLRVLKWLVGDRARITPESRACSKNSPAPAIEPRTFTTLDTVRGDLLGVYAEARAPLLHLPNYAVTAFGERLDRHGAEPGFVAVLAYADGHYRPPYP